MTDQLPTRLEAFEGFEAFDAAGVHVGSARLVWPGWEIICAGSRRWGNTRAEAERLLRDRAGAVTIRVESGVKR